MSIESRRGAAIGAFMALAVPIGFLLLGVLVDHGLAPIDRVRPLLDVLGGIGWISLFVLGPAGIVIAGWSAGVRSIGTWIALMVVALPIVSIVWFIGVATMSGALGNPF